MRDSLAGKTYSDFKKSKLQKFETRITLGTTTVIIIIIIIIIIHRHHHHHHNKFTEEEAIDECMVINRECINCIKLLPIDHFTQLQVQTRLELILF